MACSQESHSEDIKIYTSSMSDEARRITGLASSVQMLVEESHKLSEDGQIALADVIRLVWTKVFK